MQILPPETDFALRRRPATATEAGLARSDAAAFMIGDADPAAALAKLPHAALWQSLYRKSGRTATAPLLVTRLPNARHTLAAVGFVGPDASAFERLTLAGRLMREIVKPGVASLQCHAAALDATASAAALEALASAAMAHAVPMPQRKSKPTPAPDLRTIDVHGGRTADLELAAATAAGNHLARWLTTLPPNELDCVAYRRALAQLARREGWSFRFYDERALERLGAGAFLAVTRANEHRGAGIARLTYRPRGTRVRRRIGLVGKGICFDTGGINLKSHKGMFQMHGDMQGSAVAVGTLLALARRSAPVEIDCWLALTENQIGPRAYRPQEVVRASNGVTIQVVHSDAEGRMVLADTLALAARQTRPVARFRHAHRGVRERAHGALQRRIHQSLVPRAGAAVGGPCERRTRLVFPDGQGFRRRARQPDRRRHAVLDGQQGRPHPRRALPEPLRPGRPPWVHVDLSSSEHKGGLAHVPTEFTGFGVRFAAELLGDGAWLERLESRP